MKWLKELRVLDLFMIFLGSLIFAWSLTNINIPNKLADGGVSGIALIFKALFNVDPGLSVLMINIPLFVIGYRFLGLKSLIYTFWGIITFSGALSFWGMFKMAPDLHHDQLIAAILSGILGGFGSGIIYHFGGTTGGTDVVARIMEDKVGISMGRSLFVLDVIVLLCSLVYINIVQMMYTIIYSFVFMQLVNYTQQGAYSGKVFMIFTNKTNEMANQIMNDLGRGTTIIKAVGGYTHNSQNIVYVVVDPSEMNDVRDIINKIDRKAFVSIYDAQEQIGEGFTFDRRRRSIFKVGA